MTKYQEIQLTETYPFTTFIKNPDKSIQWRFSDKEDCSGFTFYCNTETNSMNQAIVKFMEWEKEHLNQTNNG